MDENHAASKRLSTLANAPLHLRQVVASGHLVKQRRDRDYEGQSDARVMCHLAPCVSRPSKAGLGTRTNRFRPQIIF